MTDGIYPNFIRENCFASRYCELAMDHYYEALHIYKDIESKNFHASMYAELHAMENHIIATIVFSGMCLESFFNDYAAACLGDDEFYEYFDKLDVKNKFVLIAKFILKAEVDRSKSYYFHLTSLIKKRNYFVHNKSHKSAFQGYSEEEIQEIREMMPQDLDYDNMVMGKVTIDEMKSDMKDGLNALKAVRDTANFFDQYDPNIYALNRLMGPCRIFDSEAQREQRKLVLSKLGIKVEQI